MGKRKEAAPILAAGGVVFDSRGRIAVIHRPAYDDWSLPKGKLDKGESEMQAAVREVQEETNCVAAPQRFLGTVYYETAKIQHETRALGAAIGERALLEAIGVASLANAMVRLAMLHE